MLGLGAPVRKVKVCQPSDSRNSLSLRATPSRKVAYSFQLTKHPSLVIGAQPQAGAALISQKCISKANSQYPIQNTGVNSESDRATATSPATAPHFYAPIRYKKCSNEPKPPSASADPKRDTLLAKRQSKANFSARQVTQRADALAAKHRPSPAPTHDSSQAEAASFDVLRAMPGV